LWACPIEDVREGKREEREDVVVVVVVSEWEGK